MYSFVVYSVVTSFAFYYSGVVTVVVSLPSSRFVVIHAVVVKAICHCDAIHKKNVSSLYLEPYEEKASRMPRGYYSSTSNTVRHPSIRCNGTFKKIERRKYESTNLGVQDIGKA